MQKNEIKEARTAIIIRFVLRGNPENLEYTDLGKFIITVLKTDIPGNVAL